VHSCGGNMLMNVGPTADGIIAPIMEERLRQFGQWLGVNGEAIYASKPWTAQKDAISNSAWLVVTFSIYIFIQLTIFVATPRGATYQKG